LIHFYKRVEDEAFAVLSPCGVNCGRNQQG